MSCTIRLEYDSYIRITLSLQIIGSIEIKLLIENNPFYRIYHRL